MGGYVDILMYDISSFVKQHLYTRRNNHFILTSQLHQKPTPKANQPALQHVMNYKARPHKFTKQTTTHTTDYRTHPSKQNYDFCNSETTVSTQTIVHCARNKTKKVHKA